MALQYQQIPLQFSGLDTKTAEQLLQPGTFLSLENCVRRKTGQIAKRNGYSTLVQSGTVTLDAGSHVDNFQNDLLVMDANKVYTYNPSNDELIDRGRITSATLAATSVVRNSYRQAMPDCAYGGGKSVFVWQDSRGSEQVRYSVFDDATGTAIVRDALIAAAGSTPRVVAINNRFIILYIVSGALKSRIINFATPTTLGSEVSVDNCFGGLFDACAYGNAVFIGYLTDADSYRVGYVTPSGAIGSGTNGWPAPVDADSTSNITSLGVYVNTTSQYVYLAYTNATLVKACAWYVTLDSAQTVTVETIAAARNVCGIVTANQTATLYYEIGAAAMVATCKNQYIKTAATTYTTAAITVTTAAAVFYRSVGLAGKPFIDGAYKYLLCAYESALQSAFYLLRSDGFIVARLSSGVGGGLTRAATPGTVPSPSALQAGLCSYYVNADGAYVYGTTIKTKFQASENGVVYSVSQGIQKSTLQLANTSYTASTVGGNYHLAGGLLFAYDGNSPVEHGFLTYPEDVTTTVGDHVFTANVNDTLTATAHGLSNDNTVTLTTTTTLPAPFVVGTTYYVINASTDTFKLSATSGGAAVNVTDTGTGVHTFHNTTGGSLPVGTYYYAVMYEWFDAQGQVHRSAPCYVNQATTVINQRITLTYPTLRLTLKDGTTRANLKVVLYRGLAIDDDQVLYRLTDAFNTTASDTATFLDTGSLLSAANLAVQEVIYTTGGVLDNTSAPASTCLTSYRGRLFLGGLEDTNAVVYSKPHVYGEGVAFSDFFVQRCDPRGGPVTALYGLDDKLILFKRDNIFVMAGDGPVDTGVNNDYSDPQLIATDVGCSLPNSIALTPLGLVFKSDKGIYLLDRSLSTQYIGAPVERYNSLTVTSAVVMEDQNEVRFTTSDGVCLVYNYFFNLWSTFSAYEAVSAVGNSEGYYHLKADGTLRVEDDSYNDAGARYKMSIETGWISFAGVQGLQRIYQIYGLGDFITDHYTRIKLAYDYEDAYTQTTYFNVDTALDLGYYGDSATYGADLVYGGTGSSVYQWELSPRRQKCQAIKLLIEDIDTKTDNGGASFNFVSLSFLAGVKVGGPRLSSNRNV